MTSLPNLSQFFSKAMTYKLLVKHCKLKLLLKCFIDIVLILFYVFGD